MRIIIEFYEDKVKNKEDFRDFFENNSLPGEIWRLYDNLGTEIDYQYNEEDNYNKK